MRKVGDMNCAKARWRNEKKKLIVDVGVQDVTVIEKQVVAVDSLSLHEQA
jgi:hypothetical protein